MDSIITYNIFRMGRSPTFQHFDLILSADLSFLNMFLSNVSSFHRPLANTPFCK